MKVLIIIFLLGISNVVYAYNSSKCKKFLVQGGRFYDGGGLCSSTTSYLSSFGPCAMIGMIEHDKQVFIADNYDNLMKEASQGRGEYLETFAQIANCNSKARVKLPQVFQKNFKMIYDGKVERDVDHAYNAMNEILRTDPILANGCGISS